MNGYGKLSGLFQNNNKNISLLLIQLKAGQ